MTVATQSARPSRPLYRLFGFTTPLRFALFALTTLSALLFSFLRLPYIDIDNVFCGTPNRAVAGECYWYGQGTPRAAMLLHLATFIPATILACLQFVPAIRRRFVLFHRLNGYVVVALSVPGAVGAVLISPYAMGGSPNVQFAAYLISAMFIVAIAKAQIGIKSGRIDQHRAWMLRAWFYAGSIVTFRPVLGLITVATSRTGPHFKAFPCAVADFILSGGSEKLLEAFPSCAPYVSGESPEEWIAVQARLGTPVGAIAAIRYAFEVATISAFVLHAIGIEIYLNMTKSENERLKEVSRTKIAAAARRQAQIDAGDDKVSKEE